jgi:hypothetical protein
METSIEHRSLEYTGVELRVSIMSPAPANSPRAVAGEVPHYRPASRILVGSDAGSGSSTTRELIGEPRGAASPHAPMVAERFPTLAIEYESIIP